MKAAKFQEERPKKTDAEIERESKEVINHVIGAHKGSAVRKIEQEMNKAFPFGPGARENEKRIWRTTVSRAVDELARWAPALALVLLLGAPAQAEVVSEDVTIDSTPALHQTIPPQTPPPIPQEPTAQVKYHASDATGAISIVGQPELKTLKKFEKDYVKEQKKAAAVKKASTGSKNKWNILRTRVYPAGNLVLNALTFLFTITRH